MKLLGVLVAIAFVLYAVIAIAFPTHTHRYRITVEIDRPEGVRSGSTVIEVSKRDVRWVLIGRGNYEYRVRGEALFIDLGAGRNVIGLLATGASASNISQMTSLFVEAYGHYRWDKDVWSGRTKLQGVVELQPPLIPTLVTFLDLSDPATARIVYATGVVESSDGRSGWRSTPRVMTDRVAELLGPGFRFKRALLEMVSEPPKQGMANRLPWWGRGGRPAHQAHLAMNNNSPFGSASPAEYLFERK
jgi:hypothetical protein